jgi:hypothetical protein
MMERLTEKTRDDWQLKVAAIQAHRSTGQMLKLPPIIQQCYNFYKKIST